MTVPEDASQQIKWGDAMAQVLVTLGSYVGILKHQQPNWDYLEEILLALEKLTDLQQEIINFDGIIDPK